MQRTETRPLFLKLSPHLNYPPSKINYPGSPENIRGFWNSLGVSVDPQPYKICAAQPSATDGVCLSVGLMENIDNKTRLKGSKTRFLDTATPSSIPNQFALYIRFCNALGECGDEWGEVGEMDVGVRNLYTIIRFCILSPSFYRGVQKMEDKRIEDTIICTACGGTCIHWNAVGGCCLELHRRPKACRELVPDKNRNCTVLFDEEATALAWVPYQQDIEEAATKIQG